MRTKYYLGERETMSFISFLRSPWMDVSLVYNWSSSFTKLRIQQSRQYLPFTAYPKRLVSYSDIVNQLRWTPDFIFQVLWWTKSCLLYGLTTISLMTRNLLFRSLCRFSISLTYISLCRFSTSLTYIWFSLSWSLCLYLMLQVIALALEAQFL